VLVVLWSLLSVCRYAECRSSNPTDENDRAERRFDAIVAPFNLIGNAHQVLHTSDEDDDNDEGQDWDSDQR
jgi:hypothetical protein